MTWVQKLLIPTAFHYKRVKTGLRSRFYLNCSHMYYGSGFIPEVMQYRHLLFMLYMYKCVGKFALPGFHSLMPTKCESLSNLFNFWFFLISVYTCDKSFQICRSVVCLIWPNFVTNPHGYLEKN